MVIFLWHGLMQNLQADFMAKDLGRFCEARCDSLKCSLCVGSKGSIISEQEVLYQLHVTQ
jgi:hypothetical protein